MTNAVQSPPVLIVPGKGGSEATHWQSWLERHLDGAQRVEQTAWDTPELAAWSANVAAAIGSATQPPLVVAHSFGCLAALHALQQATPPRVAGVLLVAPADPQRFALPDSTVRRPLGAPGRVIASSNDPWMSLARATTFARAWHLPVHCLGAAGHINVASGFGPWPQIRHWVRTWPEFASPSTLTATAS
jgi:predicted alpha/beta hydrolase family esterase